MRSLSSHNARCLNSTKSKDKNSNCKSLESLKSIKKEIFGNGKGYKSRKIRDHKK